MKIWKTKFIINYFFDLFSNSFVKDHDQYCKNKI